MALEIEKAALLLNELGNTTRLKVIRLLVQAGPSGMSVGEIQRILEIPGSTLSHHLNHLRTVGLIWQERQGTLLRCCVAYEMIEALVEFLTAECCVGSGEKLPP